MTKKGKHQTWGLRDDLAYIRRGVSLSYCPRNPWLKMIKPTYTWVLKTVHSIQLMATKHKNPFVDPAFYTLMPTYQLKQIKSFSIIAPQINF